MKRRRRPDAVAACARPAPPRPRPLHFEPLELRQLLSVVPSGVEFRVNTHTTSFQETAAVAMDADGNYVAVWESFNQPGGMSTDVYAQRYSASGVAISGEFRVNSYTTGQQGFLGPRIAMDADGDFVVVWSGEGPGDNPGIFARRFNAAGVAQGADFRVNTYTTNEQREPAIAMDADGDFVIVWESGTFAGAAGQDGSDAGIYGQRYNAAGVAQGPEFRVNTYTTNSQNRPAVAMHADGDFVVVWGGASVDDSLSISAQRYSASGIAQGGEFRVNSYITDEQRNAAVAMDHDGGFVVVWDSREGPSDFGIYGQKYNPFGVPIGGQFRVNAFTGFHSGPSIAMNAAGEFVVAWTDALGPANDPHTAYARSYNASGVADGTEFRVNTYTTESQFSPEVAIDAGGDFVVVWTSDEQDGDGTGIYGQRYKRTPSVGEENRANSSVAGNQREPVVAMDADGDYVVVWESNGADGSGYGIYAQRYNAAAVPQGGEFRVNTFTTGHQRLPSVAMDADGDFVIAWQSPNQAGELNYGVYAQRYNAGGTAQGGEIHINTYTTEAQAFASIAMDGDGDFVVTWTSFGQDGSNNGVYARRYNAFGIAQGSEFRVNATTLFGQWRPSVAMDADGDFVIIWHSQLQDGSNYGIYGQRYNAAGAAQGVEFRVNTYTTGTQWFPAVAMDGNGDFVVAWASYNQDGGGYGVYAQRYAATGVAQGSEFRINVATTGYQSQPSLAMDADGDFTVAWMTAGQDGSGYGVYAWRYPAAGGSPDEFRVNTYIAGDQGFPTVAASSTGGHFVVAWQSEGQDGSGSGIYSQLYEVPETPGIPGDFDDDTDVDANDINILADMMFRGASDPGNNDSANLNGTGGVTQDDMDYMVNTILGTVYGDADLDDDVDGADFDAWRIRDSLGGGIGWATGDWDGDNDVDGADFDHWRLRLPAIGGAGAETLVEPVAQAVASSATGPERGARGFASAAATSATRSLSNDSTQSAAARRAHAERGHEAALAKPVAHRRIDFSAVDEVLAASPMYRSRHLRWQLAIGSADTLKAAE